VRPSFENPSFIINSILKVGVKAIKRQSNKLAVRSRLKCYPRSLRCADPIETNFSKNSPFDGAVAASRFTAKSRTANTALYFCSLVTAGAQG